MSDQTDTDKLIEEIGRYLAAVDLFRSLGHEPSWRPKAADSVVSLEQFLSSRREHRVVH